MTWLYVPLVCVQESEALTSDSVRSLAPFVMWRGKPMPPRSWRRECKKGTWTTLLSGATYEPLTLRRGVEEWICSLGDTLANPFLWPEPEEARRILATFGLKFCACSWRAAPRLDSSRTSEDISRRVCAKCSKTWPSSGSMRNGTCSARKRRERLIDARGSSFLPTASAQAFHSNKGGSDPSDPSDPRGWSRGGKERLTLHGMAKAERWPTPKARDARAPGGRAEQARRSPDLPTRVGGPLNPDWVAWLMGFPIGWTDSAPLGTQSFQQWLAAHGLISQPEQA